MRILGLLFAALCLPNLPIHARAGAADSSSWRIAQTIESEVNNNLDDHTQASGSLNRVNIVCHLIESAASTYDLPLVVLIGVVWQESRFDLGAVSPAGAQGVAQFMPGTAIQTGLANPFDAVEAKIRRAFARPQEPVWKPRPCRSRLQCGSETG